MELYRRGRQSLVFPEAPVLSGFASVAGQKEGEGPLGPWFDETTMDSRMDQDSWEKAETELQKRTLCHLFEKTEIMEEQLDLIFSGDLLNQCIGSSFALRNSGIPNIGLYGACSTMAEGLLLASAAVHAGYARHAAAISSSHFAASERQYRFPLNYGGQRTPTAQWTVTGCGAALVSRSGSSGPRLTAGTIGAVYDKGIRDANNMGAAMAWAAYQTISAHFRDLNRSPSDYDLIVTGDLGALGKEILISLFTRDGIELENRYEDCGVMIFDPERQDVHCGGSGAGCSASVLCGYLLRQMKERKLNRLLFCGTGALLSPVSVQQKESIPAICHAVALENAD